MNCIFCKIIKGEIPCDKIFETDNFLAFLDIRPLSPGHALVIPRDHHRWVWDTPNIGEYFEVVAKIANAQKKALNVEMVKSIIVGDEVPHAHVHLVPHSSSEKARSFDFSKIVELNEEQKNQILHSLIDLTSK